MYKLIYRPIVVISLVLVLLVMIELFALGSMTWRNLQRIDIIKQDIKHGNQLQQLVFELLNNQRQASLVSPLVTTQKKQGQPDLHQRIMSFLDNQHPATENVRTLLKELQRLLISVDQGHQQDQIKMLQLSHEVLTLQIQEEEKLLSEVYSDSQLELKLAILIPSTIFLILMLFAYFFLNRHVISPINALEKLLSNLVKGEKQPIDDIKIDSVMQPLFKNYNQLVTRLTELEQEHQTHTYSLEREVRNATHTLLEQSHSLARAERLAAVGELAASTAHELRNPLAGIQAALENMCSDSRDEDMTERLKLVSSEINRLSGRLNDLLAYSKQQPEKAKHINLYQLIDELITLLKYQVKENISLQFQLEGNIKVFLPESELRQALLNLLLNSIQSIGTQAGTVNLQIKHQNNKLIIEISDSGVGFPESLLEQGIRPFASYKEQGTGLGLPMVQRFAKSQGGMLQLNNDSQGHACASLILPYNE